MDYSKILEDLVSREPVDEELRTAAAASIRELLEQKMKLTSELTLAKKCLEENEVAFQRLEHQLAQERRVVADFLRSYALMLEVEVEGK